MYENRDGNRDALTPKVMNISQNARVKNKIERYIFRIKLCLNNIMFSKYIHILVTDFTRQSGHVSH